MNKTEPVSLYNLILKNKIYLISILILTFITYFYLLSNNYLISDAWSTPVLSTEANYHHVYNGRFFRTLLLFIFEQIGLKYIPIFFNQVLLLITNIFFVFIFFELLEIKNIFVKIIFSYIVIVNPCFLEFFVGTYHDGVMNAIGLFMIAMSLYLYFY